MIDNWCRCDITGGGAICGNISETTGNLAPAKEQGTRPYIKVIRSFIQHARLNHPHSFTLK